MKKGFTLVEVFLTLAVIGVIAATTIPTMIHQTNKKHTIEQLKKTAATLNQAIYNSTITSGTINVWTWQTESGIMNILQNTIMPRLNVGYICSGEVNPSRYCSYPVKGLPPENADQNTEAMFKAKARVLLNDGSLVAFTDANTFLTGGGDNDEDDDTVDKPTGSDCNWGGNPKALCGVFMVDVNGSKKPNMVGKDIFYYGLYFSGSVLPYGVNEGDDFIEENCTKGSTGTTCAAKITRNSWDVCYSNCDGSPYPVRF